MRGLEADCRNCQVLRDLRDWRAFAAGTRLARTGDVDDTTTAESRQVQFERILAEMAALKHEVSVLRKEMLIVRQAVGVLLSRRS